MTNIIIGKGNFRGKGVVASRDFKKGDVVVPYDLRELSLDEFRQLAPNQHAYVHSFGGKRFLFRGPGRYVNHAEGEANTHQDLNKMADVASRSIKEGEVITTDGQVELNNELVTFMQAYEQATNSHNFDQVVTLVDKQAVYWFSDGNFEGATEIRKAFEAAWQSIPDEVYDITNVRWLAATYEAAVCIYDFSWRGTINGVKKSGGGRGTNALKRIDGNWQIVHEHLSKKA
jgi:ketosteroid isomerase-like protein